MTSRLQILTLLFCLLALIASPQNAPIASAGAVLNAPLSPSVTDVPVTVTNFIDIGSFTLTLNYNSTVVTYVSAAANPAFTGMTVTVSTPGTIVVTWPATGTGITLPDQAVLLTLSFNYISSGSNSYLTWFDSGTSCQYTKYAGGTYVVLNDQPSATYYLYGVVTNHPAPVTTAPVITGAASGAVAVPIKVGSFSNIATIYLNLEYDSTVLVYQGFVQNPLIPGSFIVGNNLSTPGKKKITMSLLCPAFALADSSILITLNFNYVNTAGHANYTALTWLDDGPSCSYSDGQSRVLYDGQTSNFYRNGLVASQKAPQTWLPEIKDASPSTPLQIPVKVSSFNNIRSFTLTFEYDPAVMTYGSFTPHASFGGTLNVTDAVSGSKRKSVISWSGASSLSLPDGSSIVVLSFTYNSGTSELKWLTDAASCRYNDNIGNACYDLPKASFYHSGLAASHAAPRIAAGYASPANGQQFTLPVITFNFKDIGMYLLTLDYDPGVLQYQGASLVPSVGGTYSATIPGPGRIIMEWSGTAATLADSSVLINLSFTKSAGSSALAWYDDGNSCKFAVSSGGPSLYDQPQSSFYINGYTGPVPLVADFNASNLLPDVNAAVTFTDLSTGGPASWFWDISPSTYAFINGTNAASKNPQVIFSVNNAYTITLIIYRGSAAGVKVKSAYIHAGTPGLWTGITSTDWQTASNWYNHQVPVAATNVLIPASAPNWPHVNGNLTIGTQCHQLTMEGSSQLTVDGQK